MKRVCLKNFILKAILRLGFHYEIDSYSMSLFMLLDSMLR